MSLSYKLYFQDVFLLRRNLLVDGLGKLVRCLLDGVLRILRLKVFSTDK